jgi:hypothetical protein
VSGKVAAGFYKGRAIAGSAQFAINESNGNESIAIDVDLGEVGQFTTFLHFTDAASPYAIERLRACGWKGDDLANLDGIDTNEITVQVKYETYQGKERMKVDIATGGGRIKLENQMSEQQKRAFAARMRGALKGNGGTQPAAARSNNTGGGGRTTRGEYDPGPDGQDDIPF